MFGAKRNKLNLIQKTLVGLLVCFVVFNYSFSIGSIVSVNAEEDGAVEEVVEVVSEPVQEVVEEQITFGDMNQQMDQVFEDAYQETNQTPEEVVSQDPDTQELDDMSQQIEDSFGNFTDSMNDMAEDLTTLKGNKYAKKRNLINQFKRNYLNNGTVTVEQMTSSAKSECLMFLDKWCDDRGCDIDDDVNLACERQALVNTIENMDLLEVSGLILRINSEISAFGMAAHLTEDMGVLYFEKALTKIKGLYQYFDNLCAKHLLAGYKYINKEY